MEIIKLIQLLEYFRDGLADVEAGSGEEEPKVNELTHWITELTELNETGLSHRQLLDQRNELNAFIKSMSIHFRSWRTLDKGTIGYRHGMEGKRLLEKHKLGK